jgi:hypothetical protein
MLHCNIASAAKSEAACRAVLSLSDQRDPALGVTILNLNGILLVLANAAPISLQGS